MNSSIYTSEEFSDTLFKKEFMRLMNPEQNKKIGNEHFLTTEIIKNGNLIANNYQLAVKQFMSPTSGLTRLLLDHSTGSGKTVSTMLVLLDFLKLFSTFYNYNKLIDNQGALSSHPEVFVVGFSSREIFVKEIFKRPEYGFITNEELVEKERLINLQRNIGGKNEEDALKSFDMRLRKRLKNKVQMGFVQFVGYKEFFIKLLIFTDEGFKKLKGLRSEKLSEMLVLESIKNGDIIFNVELLLKLINSFMVFDEIHNVYNSMAINNYGLVIRIIGLITSIPEVMAEWIPAIKPHIEKLKNAGMKQMYLSATPINNNKSEVIDAINIMVPPKRIFQVLQEFNLRSNDKKILENYTITREDLIKESELKPNGINIISALYRGYSSFFFDRTPGQYPEMKFLGEKLPIKIKEVVNKTTLHEVSYFKFIRCTMPEFQEEIYRREEIDKMPQDGQMLMELVLPALTDKDIPSYKTSDIQAIARESELWKTANSLTAVPQKIGSSNKTSLVLEGEFFAKENLKNYSSKYFRMLEELERNLKLDLGKIIISHQYVLSGVIIIAEVLRRNGWVEENGIPTRNTKCVMCSKMREEHDVLKHHPFKAARFGIIHGEVDRVNQRRILDKFNSSDNIYGYEMRILVGSSVINEGYDFREVRQLYVMRLPTDISILIQIIGRAVRKGSHLRLEAEKRNVEIGIFTSCFTHNAFAYEEKKYAKKVEEYIQIQHILKSIHSQALDAVINYDTNMASMKDVYQLGFKLPSLFDKLITLKNKNLSDQLMSPENDRQEIATIIYVIKRLVIEQSRVWTYEDLWTMVKKPGITLGTDPGYFSEKNFAVALYTLLEKQTIDIYPLLQKKSEIDKLFDDQDKSITIYNEDFRLVQVGQYIMLMPVRKYLQAENVYSDLGSDYYTTTNIPDIDLDLWHSKGSGFTKNIINITSELRTSLPNYEMLKQQFFKKYSLAPMSILPTTIEIYGMNFHVSLVQEAIKYAFNILTNKKASLSEYHEFYFKMLYFYDKLDLIIYADTLENTEFISHYKNYTTESALKLTVKKGSEGIIEKYDKYNAFLMSSAIKSAGLLKEFKISRLNKLIGQRKADAEEAKKINKVHSNLLPVGHLLSAETLPEDVLGRSTLASYGENVSFPILFFPEIKKWQLITNFANIIKITDEKENDIIVGYYSKNRSGLELNFKLRSPIQVMERKKDARLIETGMACVNKNKKQLPVIANSLGIKIKDAESTSVKTICQKIKLELISREIKERRKLRANTNHKKIRWFYLHFEEQPELK